MMLIRALRREVSNYILQTLDYIGVEHGIDDDGNGDDGDICDDYDGRCRITVCRLVSPSSVVVLHLKCNTLPATATAQHNKITNFKSLYMDIYKHQDPSRLHVLINALCVTLQS